MPEKQKDKKDGTVAEDQKERGYYYDDAHGYEEYEPEEEEQCEEPAVEPIEEAGASRPSGLANVARLNSASIVEFNARFTRTRSNHSQVRKGGLPPLFNSIYTSQQPSA